jgi:hypothetical protein
MKRLITVFSLATALVASGCGGPDGPAVEAPGEPVDSPAILERPFTAEQIRDEWTQGFQLRIRRWSPGGEVNERWTVVYADDEKVDIQSFTIDESGAEVGEPRVETSTWTELRDHATFRADRATRERATRETALGSLEGWLYAVEDPEAETVSEFFFADSLPGAPVHLRVLANGELAMEFEQLERVRPSEAP